MRFHPLTFLRLAVPACALLLAALPALAQLPTRSTMPDPVVLVVKVVGEDLVQPSTGIVIGPGGENGSQVVVPASFAEPGSELYVLDGGTDFARDGLPARILSHAPAQGLAVLVVEGLFRPAAMVTFNPPESDHELRLAAWPPAEMMAQGADPYWVPVNVAGKVTGQPQVLVPGGSVPNLTGPLIDLCGQWAGMVVASGEPGIDAAEPPRVILGDELLRIAEAMNITLRLEACMQVAPAGGLAQQTSASPTARPGTPTTTDSGGISAIIQDANFGLGALVFLLSALVSGLVFWLLVKRRAAQQRRRKIQRTLQTETMAFSPTGLPTRRTREEPTTFNPGTRPPGTNGWLRIEGTHADGRPLRAVTAIAEGKFQAVIGRAGVQLAADGPGISRKHAVIVGEAGRLTISDLGSRNGTFVNGVRCQQDEVFFVDEGDKILLGAAMVTLRVTPGKGPVT